MSSRHRDRNPPATPAAHRAVVRLARRLADEVDHRGTAAVVLAGSWARGDAHEASDIDLWVVGRSGPNRFLEREGHMVCVRYSSAGADRREMRTPFRLDGAVPGWQHAKILRDPRGVAKRLQREAKRFRWSTVRRARDAYLADQLAGWAEEVTKLLRALATGERETACVQRNLLANHMASLQMLAAERLWETENGLWEEAGRRAGRAFRSAQRAALGIPARDWRASCEAALRLYAFTARAHLAQLKGDRRRIVLAACRRTGYPIG